MSEPHRSRPRVQLTLSPEAVEILDDLANRSDYLSTLVTQQRRRWRLAEEALREDGWTSAKLHAACAGLRRLVNEYDWSDATAERVVRELAHSCGAPRAGLTAEAARDLCLLAWELSAGNLDLLRRLTTPRNSASL